MVPALLFPGEQPQGARLFLLYVGGMHYPPSVGSPFISGGPVSWCRRGVGRRGLRDPYRCHSTQSPLPRRPTGPGLLTQAEVFFQDATQSSRILRHGQDDVSNFLRPPPGRSLPRALIGCHQSCSPRSSPSSGWAQRGGVPRGHGAGEGRAGAPRGLSLANVLPHQRPSQSAPPTTGPGGRKQKVLEGAVGGGEGLEGGLCGGWGPGSPREGGLQEDLGT